MDELQRAYSHVFNAFLELALGIPGNICTMVGFYAQVVSRTDCRGNTQIAPCIVLSHYGVASHTVLTEVGVETLAPKRILCLPFWGCASLRPYQVWFSGPCLVTNNHKYSVRHAETR